MMQVPGQSLHWRPAQFARDKPTIKMQVMVVIFFNGWFPCVWRSVRHSAAPAHRL
jgi:hypothetical protein